MNRSTDILATPIEFLKGMGPQRADLLKKELAIYTFADLLEHYPNRHIDRTRLNYISDITPITEFAQVAGILSRVELIGQKGTKRLIAELKDKTGSIELIWFQGAGWVEKLLETGQQYLVYGRVSFYQGVPQIVHPEFEILRSPDPSVKSYLEPVYPSTEKLKSRNLGGRQIAKFTRVLLDQLTVRDIPENIPERVIKNLKLPRRFEAFNQIHFPANQEQFEQAVRRLKFEEFFIAQLRMNVLKINRHRFSKGVVFDKVGNMFNEFYNNYLPFSLTGAQKRVIREIRQDTATGRQMNRLLQGDVG